MYVQFDFNRIMWIGLLKHVVIIYWRALVRRIPTKYVHVVILILFRPQSQTSNMNRKNDKHQIPKSKKVDSKTSNNIKNRQHFHNLLAAFCFLLSTYSSILFMYSLHHLSCLCCWTKKKKKCWLDFCCFAVVLA